MTVTTFAAYGDSTTSRASAWLPHVDGTVQHVGGYAQPGFTSAEVLAHVTPVEADVTVIMLGTNDVADGLTTPSRTATKNNLIAIAEQSGAHRVLLAAIAPCDEISELDRRTLGFALNRDLSQLAADHGWAFADPWSSVRLLSNGWASGASSDKVHPTDATSTTYTGPRMSHYIRQAHTGADLITNGV